MRVSVVAGNVWLVRLHGDGGPLIIARPRKRAIADKIATALRYVILKHGGYPAPHARNDLIERLQEERVPTEDVY